MKNKIAAYVFSSNACSAYKIDSYDVRRFTGLEMIRDSLIRGGCDVGYCGKDTAEKYDIVLVSITSSIDWWQYIREREQWGGNPCAVIGGAGVLNVRPFLKWFDIAVFGRGENIILGLVKSIMSGDRYDSDSVCYSSDFNPSDDYKIAQAAECYPHELAVPNRIGAKKKGWSERSIGCKRSCSFCAYTWHRTKRYTSVESYTSGGDNEKTMLDLDINKPATWDLPHLRNIGLDGLSEKTRMSVNKPITSAMFRKFLTGLAHHDKPHQLKLYCVAGLPGETEEDWLEHLEDISGVDEGLGKQKQWSLLLMVSPFRAMPATPAAGWPMSKRCYRSNSVSAFLKRPNMKGNIYFQGNAFWAVEGMGTNSLSSIALDAIVLRGIESDSEAVSRIALSRRFWNASASRKLATLEQQFNLDLLFGEYSMPELPTRYLQGKIKMRKLTKT